MSKPPRPSPILKFAAVLRRTLAAAARGDLLAAAARLPERELLLRAAPPAVAADADVIREILRLDRDLSGAIRERMVAIRDEALKMLKGL